MLICCEKWFRKPYFQTENQDLVKKMTTTQRRKQSKEQTPNKDIRQKSIIITENTKNHERGHEGCT